MVIRPFVSLLLVLFFAIQPALAQPAVLSNDYWLSYLPSLDNTAPVWVLASTQTPGTKVRVTYSEDGTFDEFTINPNQPKEYRINVNTMWEAAYIMAKPSKAETVQKRSIHIQSSAPISVQQFTNGDKNVSLSFPIPSVFLGRNYVVAAYNDQDSAYIGNNLMPRSSGEFIVIAPEDSTLVTLVPSGKTSGGLMPGDTAHILLNKGETYLVKGLADSSSNDLSGSRIFSDKPVSVIAGAEIMRAFDVRVIEHQWDYNDHIAEYMVPVEQWGTECISTPLTNKKGIALDTWGDLIRVFAAEETNLYVNGETQSLGTRWDFANVTEAMHFSANKPIMVVQYDYFVDNTVSEASKPRASNSMMLLQPRHQWVNEASLVLPAGYERTYVYITADTDSLKLITASVNGSANVPIHSRKDGGTPVISIGDYSTIAIVFAERGQVAISGPCQFSVRNHGTKDNDQISVTYSYGAVTASTFGQRTSSNFAVRIDTICEGFTLAIEDTAATGDGIADIQLISGQSSNVRLIVPPYPIGSKRVEARVEQIAVSQIAKATVLIRSREGKQRTITLTVPAHTLSAPQHLTEFRNILYGDTACKDIAITNTGASDETITFIMFEKGSPQFSITSDRDFPFTLAPGETFIATVCYIPPDTGIWHDDTLKIDLECSSIELQSVRGIGKVPIVFAEDKDFKVVRIGDEKRENIKVTNESYEVPLTITGWDVTSTEFSFDPSEQARLPVVLAPRANAMFLVAYKPMNVGKDTAMIEWYTDIVPPYRDTNRKDWSVLIGEGLPSQSVERDAQRLPSVQVAGGMLQIQLQENERFVSASIFDITGREYRLESLFAPIDNLPAGAYIVRVITSERTFNEKLIVH